MPQSSSSGFRETAVLVEVFRQLIANGDDVFLIRQRGREIAAAIGFDDADQVRIATALSEVGRDALAGGTSTAVFEIDPETNRFVIGVDGFPKSLATDSPGIVSAKRLMFAVAIDPDGEGAVKIVLSRKLPAATTIADVARARDHIAEQVAATPLDELRRQNQQLIDNIEAVEAARESLVQLNAELEETNKGVMAMYTQLSDELDSTNRGVVALYNELDDKSRQIEAASEAKSRFLSSISHELRGPANSILGLAALLVDPVDGLASTEHRQQVELIASSAGELIDLVSQLLDLAKAESGRLDPTWTAVDLTALLSDVVAMSRPLALNDVTIELAAPSQTVVVTTDEHLLRQVVRNLLSNALAFTEVGTVRVRVSVEPDGTVIVDVEDSGVGLSPENIDRVFEEFFQVRNHLQSRRRGTGLGLPYSRRVIEALGGTLTASSRPGVGSTFRVQLQPLAAETEARPTLKPDSRHDATVHGGIGVVLVIDDDDGFRAIVRQMLAPFAHLVLEADDGASGLDALIRHDIDIVLLDFHLPDISGTDLLASIKTDPRWRDLPVAVITAANIDEDLRQQTSAAAAIISKRDLTQSSLLTLVRAISADVT